MRLGTIILAINTGRNRVPLKKIEFKLTVYGMLGHLFFKTSIRITILRVREIA